LKNIFLLVMGNTSARIPDLYCDKRASAPASHDDSSDIRVAHCVRNQVANDTLNESGIGIDGCAGRRVAKRDAFGDCLACIVPADAFEQRANWKWPAIHGHDVCIES
jgi:hypothetical protein